jgi:methionine aminopeptidase
VMNAAYLAAEIAARTIRPGNTNRQVTEAVKVAAETYGVQAIAGTLMHQVKRYVIDAAKVRPPLGDLSPLLPLVR